MYGFPNLGICLRIAGLHQSLTNRYAIGVGPGGWAKDSSIFMLGSLSVAMNGTETGVRWYEGIPTD